MSSSAPVPSSPPVVLVTGFEPFGGETENASRDAVALLADRWRGPARLLTATLPVTFHGCGPALAALLAEHRPGLVVAVGEAGGRRVVSVERWARNHDEARIGDNAGARPVGPIDRGPDRLASRLDVDGAVAALRRAGLAVEASEDAGAFVCNHLFRWLLTATDVPAGFVHVPALRVAGVAGVGSETDGPGVVTPSSAVTDPDVPRPLPGTRMTRSDLATALDVLLHHQLGRGGARWDEGLVGGAGSGPS